EAIATVIKAVDLPIDGLREHLGNFLVLRNGDEVVGCVGLEIYDEVAILRSLAVVTEHRGEGLGWMLADNAVERARQSGVRRLYLLTETATDFFANHFGFRIIDRQRVEPPANQSAQFTSGVYNGATAMRLDL